MTTKIPRVPVSLNEALIERHFAVDPTTRAQIADPLLVEIRDAMSVARQSGEKARRVTEAIMANEMDTLAARHRRAKNEGWKAMEPALRRLDAARGKVLSELEELVRQTSEPPRPKDAVASLLAGEIRSRLAAMTPSDRKRALDTAMNDGDDAVVGAVLQGPPMLSGMSGRAEHDVVRARWRQARYPAELDRIARVQKALADLDRGGNLAVTFVSTLADSDVVAAAEASEQAVADALRS